MKLYVVEYMHEGSGVPVDCTVGLSSKRQAIKHGRKVSSIHGHCGFWISVKPAVSGIDPKRLEFHPVHLSPNGKRAVFGKPLYAKQGGK